MSERAILFVDGNNWYHALHESGVRAQGGLDYRRISEKLVGPRQWIGTRYYIGRMDQSWNPRVYGEQRAFLAALQRDDGRISVHLGRLERKPAHNEAADELLRYLASLAVRIDPTVYQALVAIGQRHRSTTVLVEKAVDVMVAVDLVVMAERNEYDTAYLLSADGDFTPAVRAVRGTGRKVYAASPATGAQLAQACNTYIRLKPDWFADCYRSA